MNTSSFVYVLRLASSSSVVGSRPRLGSRFPSVWHESESQISNFSHLDNSQLLFFTFAVNFPDYWLRGRHGARRAVVWCTDDGVNKNLLSELAVSRI